MERVSGSIPTGKSSDSEVVEVGAREKWYRGVEWEARRAIAGLPHILVVGSGSPPNGSDGFGGENKVTPVGQQLVRRRSIGGREVSSCSAEDWALSRAADCDATARAAASDPGLALPPFEAGMFEEVAGVGSLNEGCAKSRLMVAGVI